ncbi:MAG: hypothetical protein PHF56_00235 [Desulfuromonadaceae bacterium]|nr:hypothetical protein [Desulfuromonadaceae bacterium]
MNSLGIFPFGTPVLPITQHDRTRKKVFVLGVYASAVHARWIGADKRQRIGAVAVAPEPEIFWRGDEEEARAIISAIAMPDGTGQLVPASSQLNGPSGRALDDLFLKPLCLTREDAWLCDLVPHSCMNEKQSAALAREYDPLAEHLGLPAYNWPTLPTVLADEQRRAEIASELSESGADIVITLGDHPLKWFTRHYGTEAALSNYGKTPKDYGRLHPIAVNGHDLQLLPLVHPRQAAKLGSHSSVWADLHEQWAAQPSTKLFLA